MNKICGSQVSSSSMMSRYPTVQGQRVDLKAYDAFFPETKPFAREEPVEG